MSTVSSTTDLVVDLAGADYTDRVYGCWQGKNAGGTLGTPLEEAWGREEPFDVWWYPELQEGGLPNDDLEMQLVWLKAVEEVGPGITARDLSRYWLDHIGYNFDEYGLSKLNLRLGLEPPVSGHYNNWFTDCMGSPIRSEIWACLAPGAPRVAARYAYQDAICDHAGGEGVYGELFNAALESAAFVVQDPQLLIDIALSYIPQDCAMRTAVVAARNAHAAGLDWKQARRAVLDATPHYNAQYSPINTGFQVIGLLYGTDFGNGICTTVNCGYDTDSSGAAIGSYLGIILGSAGLPEEWVAPLGTGISTNESWGGVRHLADGTNPVPADLDELIARIRVAAQRVLRERGVLGEGTSYSVVLDDLYADAGIAELLACDPNTVPFPGEDLDVAIAYVDGPGCVPGAVQRIRTRLTNRRLDPIDLTAALRVPAGWTAPLTRTIALEAGGTELVEWEITPGPLGTVRLANHCWLELVPQDRPVPPALPVVLVGSHAVRRTPVLAAEGRTVDELLDAPFAAETATSPLSENGRPGPWEIAWADGHAQPVELDRAGVRYLQAFINCPSERDGFLVIDPSCPIRYWLNGVEIGQNREFRLIRPNQKSAEGIGADVHLRQGWNEILVKLVHDGEHAPAELHLAFSSPFRIHAYAHDLDWAAFPWSSTQPSDD
ncbi:MAG: ADP-ribosylglycohydrolase family protein [Propionicimonas sp.]|uniref:ADP-ribosylglycohydrolase family protein n=1 Tax=Propionicimonas sp. TaxID=1955623 RepID=UPI002B1F76AD|nr:ADP-ribosylglycohydrolase family protein [Propionicimonas sp.]MEA4945667.1 ADP-ribosylglycohydrolase family protein [Propionicimonas sp.]